MKILEQIEIRKTDINRLSLDSAPTETNLLRDGLEIYGSAFKEVFPQEDADLALVRMSLVSHNFNTLYLATEASFSGFYIQALGFLRNVYENWLAFWYLAKYPDDKHFWLEADPQMRPPKAEVMRNKMDHPSKESKTTLSDLYGILNRFTHTDPVVTLSHYREESGKPAVFVGIDFDIPSLQSCTYSISLLIGQMLDAVSDWIPKESEWHFAHDNIKTRILDYMDWYNEHTTAEKAGP